MACARPTTRSGARMRSTSALYERRCWNGTATAAGCATRLERGKRTIIVHHRVPGRSELKLMISLCPGCHARVHRTRAVLAAMPPLLLELWREQHPKGHEQTALDFKRVPVPPTPVRLF